MRNVPSSFWSVDFIVDICLYQGWEWNYLLSDYTNA